MAAAGRRVTRRGRPPLLFLRIRSFQFPVSSFQLPVVLLLETDNWKLETDN